MQKKWLKILNCPKINMSSYFLDDKMVKRHNNKTKSRNDMIRRLLDSFFQFFFMLCFIPIHWYFTASIFFLRIFKLLQAKESLPKNEVIANPILYQDCNTISLEYIFVVLDSTLIPLVIFACVH